MGGCRRGIGKHQGRLRQARKLPYSIYEDARNRDPGRVHPHAPPQRGTGAEASRSGGPLGASHKRVGRHGRTRVRPRRLRLHRHTMGGRDHIAFNDGSDGDQAPLRGPEGGHASDASSSLVFQVSACTGLPAGKIMRPKQIWYFINHFLLYGFHEPSRMGR